MVLNYCSSPGQGNTRRWEEAQGVVPVDYEKYPTVEVAPPLPPQGDWDGQERPKSDSRAKMREVGAEAIRICCGDRNTDYGPPEDNHANTALLWNAYLVMINQRALSGYDVCQMMAMVKVARNEHKRKADNCVDQIGYILNAHACQES